jgi:hypothetical protein
MFIRIQAFPCLFVQDSFNEGFFEGKFCYDFRILIYAFFAQEDAVLTLYTDNI